MNTNDFTVTGPVAVTNFLASANRVEVTLTGNASAPFAVTVTFDEDLDPLNTDAGQVTATNATVLSVTNSGARDVVLSVQPNGVGDIEISFIDNAVHDLTFNGNV